MTANLPKREWRKSVASFCQEVLATICMVFSDAIAMRKELEADRYDARWLSIMNTKSGVLDVFELVVVINLDSRKDRLREIQAQLSSIGLGFHMSRVVRLSASQPTDPGEFPSIGARGCFYSHLRALQLAQNRGSRSVLILEDDTDFAGNVKDLMAYLKGSEWSIFYGGFLSDVEMDSSPVSVIAPETPLMGAHCIGLRDVIPDVIDYLSAIAGRQAGDPSGGPMHVDGAYTRFRKESAVRTLAANPMIAVQRSSRSDIAGNRWFDRIPVLRGGVAVARGFISR